MTLPNGYPVASAERDLALYDARRRGGYKNQAIAAREQLARRCGMGVRELRAWLRAREDNASSECECLDGGHDSGDGVHCLCTGVMPRAQRVENKAAARGR